MLLPKVSLAAGALTNRIYRLKTGRVFSATYNTREEAKNDIVDYLEMDYNSRRRHSYLINLSPAGFEKAHHLKKRLR